MKLLDRIKRKLFGCPCCKQKHRKPTAKQYLKWGNRLCVPCFIHINYPEASMIGK